LEFPEQTAWQPRMFDESMNREHLRFSATDEHGSGREGGA